MSATSLRTEEMTTDDRYVVVRMEECRSNVGVPTAVVERGWLSEGVIRQALEVLTAAGRGHHPNLDLGEAGSWELTTLDGERVGKHVPERGDLIIRRR